MVKEKKKALRIEIFIVSSEYFPQSVKNQENTQDFVEYILCLTHKGL